MRPKRLGAASYSLWLSFAVVAWSLATVVLCESVSPRALASGPMQISRGTMLTIVASLGLLLGLVAYDLSSRRLKDLGLSPLWSMVLAFPLLTAVTLPYLCAVSGSPYENQYGPAPEPAGFLKVLGAAVAVLVALHFGFSALMVFARMRHYVPG